MKHKQPISSQLRRGVSSLLLSLHQDDRGNMAVLVLMTLWAFVALTGFLWNEGEYATRREQVQAAADDSAHAAATWTSRTTNLIDANNMQICTAATAESIYDAITPTLNNIQAKIQAEQKQANLLLYGNQPGVPEKNIPDCEYVRTLNPQPNPAGQLLSELNTLEPNYMDAATMLAANLDPPKQALYPPAVQAMFQQRQALLQTLMNINVPQWVNEQVVPRLNAVLTADQQELQINQSIQQQTQPGLDAVQPQTMQNQRATLFQMQQTLVQDTPTAVEAQRAHNATDGKTTITLTTTAASAPEPNFPPNSSPSDATPPDPTQITAPVETADVPQPTTKVDLVRATYPTEALDAGLDLTVTLDPINFSTGDNAVWHPGYHVSNSYNVPTIGNMYFDFQVPGGKWGQLECAPLARYFWDRLDRDKAGLDAKFQPIDDIRHALGDSCHPFPAPVPVTSQLTLPLIQTTADKPLTSDQIQQINTVNQAVQQYNKDVAAANKGVWQPVISLYNKTEALVGWDPQPNASPYYDPVYDGTGHGIYDGSATHAYAVSMWDATSLYWAHTVLDGMGTQKAFMIVKPYNLYPLPDWAIPAATTSAQKFVHDYIMSHSFDSVFDSVRSQIYGQLSSKASDLGVWKVIDPSGKMSGNPVAGGDVNSLAYPVAQEILEQAASIIAPEAAAEWVSRPWPFELPPPQTAVPPNAGVEKTERLYFYSLLASATGTDNQTNPHNLYLSKIFKPDSTPMLAIAQAETFNWNEFSQSYGAAERFDQVTSWHRDWILDGYPSQLGWGAPWTEYSGTPAGPPEPWRLSTLGGWNYQPRLAHADGLSNALTNNSTFATEFQKSGITTTDDTTLTTLVHH